MKTLIYVVNFFKKLLKHYSAYQNARCLTKVPSRRYGLILCLGKCLAVMMSHFTVRTTHPLLLNWIQSSFLGCLLKSKR